jgi:hypothetical protein
LRYESDFEEKRKEKKYIFYIFYLKKKVAQNVRFGAGNAANTAQDKQSCGRIPVRV